MDAFGRKLIGWVIPPHSNCYHNGFGVPFWGSLSYFGVYIGVPLFRETIIYLGSFPSVAVTTMGYRSYKNPLNKNPLRTATGRGNDPTHRY